MSTKEFCQETRAMPLIEWEGTDTEGNPILCAIYIGKARSNLGNTAYWLGSSLGDDGGDLHFRSFAEAAEYAKSHFQLGYTLLPVEEF